MAAHTVPALIAPSNPPANSVQVPVLTYHRVAPLSAVGLTDLKVEPANFVAELAALQAGGYHTISQAQLFDALYKGAKLPTRPVIISVDDGYVDDITRILPALQRFHMVATFFVITGRMTEPGFLTADQIRQLDQAGMDVGDHTAHHVDLRLLTAGAAADRDRRLKAGARAGSRPPGVLLRLSVRGLQRRRRHRRSRAGFTLAYSTAGGTTERTAAPLTMPRVHVGRAETPGGLVSLLGGA